MTKKSLLACLLFLLATAALASAEATTTSLGIGTLDPLEGVAPLPATPGLDHYVRNLFAPPIVAVNQKWEWECILCEALPTPVVATQSAETKKKAPEMRATWRLRDGLAWSDGQPVTGYDVAMTFTLLRMSIASDRLRQLFPIVKVEVDPKDPRMFTMVYRIARFDYLSLSSVSLIPSHQFRAKPSIPVTNETYAQAVAYYQNLNGTLAYGPYQLTEINAHRASFKRNPNFHVAGTQAFDTLDVTHYGSLKEMQDALKRGQIQLTADAWQHPGAYTGKENEQFGHATRIQGPAVAIEQLTFNLRNPILADQSVRRAIAMAVDRKAIARLVAGDESLVTQLPVAPDDPLYAAASLPEIPYDLKKAADLLNGAGWRLGDDNIREKGGQKLDLTLSTTHEPARTETFAILKKSLTPLGVRFEIDATAPGDFVHDVLSKARFRDIALHSWINQTPDVFWAAWHSSQIPSHLNAYHGQNISGWFEKNVDKPLEALEKALTTAEQKTLVNEIIKVFQDDQPCLPLYQKPAYVWVDKKVKGFHMAARGFASSAFSYGWSPGP